MGSSSTTMSHSRLRSAASATRRRWPLAQVVDQSAAGDVEDQAREHVTLTFGVARPLVLLPVADDRVDDGATGCRGRSVWSSMPRVTPRRRVTRPSSGSCSPARMRSRVDLPVAVAPDDADAVGRRRCRRSRPSRTTRVGYSTRSCSAPSRWAIPTRPTGTTAGPAERAMSCGRVLRPVSDRGGGRDSA